MKHEVSYIIADDLKSVRSVVNRMAEIGFDCSYKEFRMDNGVVYKFCVFGDDWVELPNMGAVLKWLCAEIYRLNEAYNNGIVRKEVTDAEQ
jgi:hypothetical protein